jgi:O-antigen ligase
MAIVISACIAAASLVAFLGWPYKSLVILVFVLPFSIALNPWPGVDLQIFRLVVPIFWFAVMIRFPRNFLRAALHPAALFLWLFLIITVLTSWIAIESAWSFRKVLYFWSLAPFVPAVAALLNANSGKLKLVALVRSAVFGGVIAAAAGVAQFISQFFVGSDALFRFFANLAPSLHGSEFGALVAEYPSWFVNIAGVDYLRAFAFFPDPHMLAFYLSIIGASVLSILLYAAATSSFLVVAPSYILLAICLLLTFSRGGYLGFLAGLIIVLLVSRHKIGVKFAAITAGLVGAALVFTIVNAPFVSRLVSSFDSSEGSNAGRLALWSQAIEIVPQHLLGVGLGNYAVLTADFDSARNPVTTHNLYLDLLVETGVLGFFAFIGFLTFVAAALFKQAMSEENAIRAVAIGFIGALAGFCVHSFFEVPLYSPGVFVLLMLVAGVAISYRQPNRYRY